MRNLAAVLLLALPLPALAQEPPPADAIEVDDENPNVVYDPETEIEFDILGVMGTGNKPTGILITEPKRPVFNPLIELRTEFSEEMAQSLDEIG